RRAGVLKPDAGVEPAVDVAQRRRYLETLLRGWHRIVRGELTARADLVDHRCQQLAFASQGRRAGETRRQAERGIPTEQPDVAVRGKPSHARDLDRISVCIPIGDGDVCWNI